MGSANVRRPSRSESSRRELQSEVQPMINLRKWVEEARLES